jgi:hypothetical protein
MSMFQLVFVILLALFELMKACRGVILDVYGQALIKALTYPQKLYPFETNGGHNG